MLQQQTDTPTTSNNTATATTPTYRQALLGGFHYFCSCSRVIKLDVSKPLQLLRVIPPRQAYVFHTTKLAVCMHPKPKALQTAASIQPSVRPTNPNNRYRLSSSVVYGKFFTNNVLQFFGCLRAMAPAQYISQPQSAWTNEEPVGWHAVPS